MFGFCKVMGFAAAVMSVAALACAESRLSQAVKPLSNEAMSVVKIDKSSPVDLAVIDAGLRRGLRAGLRLSVTEANAHVGDLIIAEVSLDRAVALLVGNFDISEGAKVAINVGR